MAAVRLGGVLFRRGQCLFNGHAPTELVSVERCFSMSEAFSENLPQMAKQTPRFSSCTSSVCRVLHVGRVCLGGVTVCAVDRHIDGDYSANRFDVIDELEQLFVLRWHDWLDHIISAKPNISGFDDVRVTGVPTEEPPVTVAVT